MCLRDSLFVDGCLGLGCFRSFHLNKNWIKWEEDSAFSVVSLINSKLFQECPLKKKSLLLNSCPGQTQQQQEEGTFSQVSGSTGNKQAEYWKTFLYHQESEVRLIRDIFSWYRIIFCTFCQNVWLLDVLHFNTVRWHIKRALEKKKIFL